MAVYFLRSKHICRSNGSRVTRAAAYRAGERIRNEATSEVFDYSSRHDVAFKEIVLPSDLADRADMAWAKDRGTLWNAAEHAGLRCNSRLAREWLVFLPPELRQDQRRELAQRFAQGLADRYRAALDVCVHHPRAGADPRNHHAHLLMTTREVGPDGLGARTRLEAGGRERHLKGIPGSSRDEYLAIRAEWADLTNAALERAGMLQRIDHRSLKAQGIDREPTVTIPEKVWYAERSGRSSAAGTEIRARHRERLEARKRGPEALASIVEKQRRNLKSRLYLDKHNGKDRKPPPGSMTRDQRNALRREYYRKCRERDALNPSVVEARRAASLRSYHLRMQKNPEGVREARIRYRAGKGDELNRKQREYRHKNAETINQKRRAQRRIKAAEMKHGHKPSAQIDRAKAAASRWRAHREQHGPPGTALAAAQRWKKFRSEQISPKPSSHDRQKARESEGIESDTPRRTRFRRQGYDLER